MVIRSYYLDASVGDLKDFEALFKRAQSFAARALERLADPQDSEFARVFEIIFKTPVADCEPMCRSPKFRQAVGQSSDHALRPVLAHVRRELHSFANDWARTETRAAAEVRIHWNWQKRFVQDGPGVIADHVNDMVSFGSMESMEPLWRRATAFVSRNPPVDPQLSPWEQHPQHNVIDFTERARNQNSTWKSRTGALAGLTGRSVHDVTKGLLEAMLIHEMMHCEAYRLRDFYSDRGNTAGWDLIAGLTKQQSYVCAESIAMLCIAAALADLPPADLPSGQRYTISSDGIITSYCNKF